MLAARRFALVCPNYHPRTCGVGDHSMRLAQELRRRGFEAEIFTRGPALPNPEAPTVPVTGVSGTLPLLIAERIRRELDRFAPTDLIIQYTPQMFDAWRWGSAATLWLAMEARRKGVNVVVLAHELFLSWSRRPDLALGAALLRGQFAALAALANRLFVTVEARARRVAGWLRVARIKSNVGVIQWEPARSRWNAKPPRAPCVSEPSRRLAAASASTSRWTASDSSASNALTPS